MSLPTLDVALNESLAKLQSLTAQRSELDEEIRRTEQMIEGLRAAIGVYDNDGNPAPNETPLHDLTRTEAILWLLRKAEEPLSPRQIQEQLRAAGRSDGYNAVSAALSHLAATERAHTVRRGLWAVGPRPGVTSAELEVHAVAAAKQGSLEQAAEESF